MANTFALVNHSAKSFACPDIRQLITELRQRWHNLPIPPRPSLALASNYYWLLSEDEINLLDRAGIWPVPEVLVHLI